MVATAHDELNCQFIKHRESKIAKKWGIYTYTYTSLFKTVVQVYTENY